jgi:calcium/calmodulin-dependent protein kinase I
LPLKVYDCLFFNLLAHFLYRYGSILAGKFDYNDENWSLVSEAAKDFINHLLVVSPDKRMTAKDALAHPWLSTTANVDLLPQVRKNFKARRTFKKAILAVNMMKKMEKLKGSSNNNLRSSEDEKSS